MESCFFFPDGYFGKPSGVCKSFVPKFISLMMLQAERLYNWSIDVGQVKWSIQAESIYNCSIWFDRGLK